MEIIDCNDGAVQSIISIVLTVNVSQAQSSEELSVYRKSIPIIPNFGLWRGWEGDFGRWICWKMLQFFHKGIPRHRPIAASMLVARRKTGHMEEKRSRDRWIGVFVCVAYKEEIWMRWESLSTFSAIGWPAYN